MLQQQAQDWAIRKALYLLKLERKLANTDGITHLHEDRTWQKIALELINTSTAPGAWMPTLVLYTTDPSLQKAEAESTNAPPTRTSKDKQDALGLSLKQKEAERTKPKDFQELNLPEVYLNTQSLAMEAFYTISKALQTYFKDMGFGIVPGINDLLTSGLQYIENNKDSQIFTHKLKKMKEKYLKNPRYNIALVQEYKSLLFDQYNEILKNFKIRSAEDSNVRNELKEVKNEVLTFLCQYKTLHEYSELVGITDEDFAFIKFRKHVLDTAIRILNKLEPLCLKMNLTLNPETKENMKELISNLQEKNPTTSNTESKSQALVEKSKVAVTVSGKGLKTNTKTIKSQVSVAPMVLGAGIGFTVPLALYGFRALLFSQDQNAQRSALRALRSRIGLKLNRKDAADAIVASQGLVPARLLLGPRLKLLDWIHQEVKFQVGQALIADKLGRITDPGLGNKFQVPTGLRSRAQWVHAFPNILEFALTDPQQGKRRPSAEVYRLVKANPNIALGLK